MPLRPVSTRRCPDQHASSSSVLVLSGEHKFNEAKALGSRIATVIADMGMPLYLHYIGALEDLLSHAKACDTVIVDGRAIFCSFRNRGHYTC
jgi:hypothetical protein